jgi:hypothetical protein
MCGKNGWMTTTPDRPDAASASSRPKWWIKPAVLSALNVAVVLIAVTFLVGWSTPVTVAVIVAFALGSWWFLDQRPTR